MGRKNFDSLFSSIECNLEEYGNIKIHERLKEKQMYKASLYQEEMKDLMKEVVSVLEPFLNIDDSTFEKKETKIKWIEKKAKEFIYIEFLIYSSFCVFLKDEVRIKDIPIIFLNEEDYFWEEEFDKILQKKTTILFGDSYNKEHFALQLDWYFFDLPTKIRLYDLKKEDTDEIIVDNTMNLAYNFQQKDLFKRIMQDSHPFRYKITFLPFPTSFHMEKYFVIEKPNNEFSDKKNKKKNEKQIKKYFTGEDLNMVHEFPMTKHIEDVKEKKVKWEKINEVLNLVKAAVQLEKKDAEGNWLAREKEILLEKIDYVKQKFVTEKFKLQQITHIIGMLGAGKSTLTSLLVKNLVDAGMKILILENDVQKCLDLKKKFKVFGIESAVFMGNDKEEHRDTFVSNVGHKYDDIISFAKNEEEFLDTMDSTSLIKSLRNYEKQDEHKEKVEKDDRLPEIIWIPEENKDGKIKYKPFANPEYHRMGAYKMFYKMIDAPVWIGNYESFLKTKMPYALDIYKRDLFTLSMIRSNLIIADEVDNVQLRFDDAFVDSLKVVADDGEKNKNEYFLDFLYVKNPSIKKSRKDDLFTQKYSVEINNLNTITSYMYPFLLNNPTIQKDVFQKTFTRNRLLVNFFKTYIKTDKKDKISLNPAFKKLMYLFTNEWKNEEIKKMDKMFFSYYQLYYFLFKDSNHLIGSKSKNDEEKRKRIEEFLDIFCVENSINLKEIAYANTSKKSRYNEDLLIRFEFIIIFSLFDRKMKYLYNHYYAFAKRVGLLKEENLKNNFGRATSDFINPFLPAPYIHDIFSYKLTDTNGEGKKLELFRYDGVGRKLLFKIPEIIQGLEECEVPALLMLSGTSYSPKSSKYHTSKKPDWVLSNQKQEKLEIKAEFYPAFYNNLPIKVSGSEDVLEKEKKLEQIVDYFIKQKTLEKEFERMQEEYEKKKEKNFIKRRIVAMPVFSFEIAEILGEILRRKTNYNIKVQYSSKAKVKGVKFKKPKDYHVSKNEIEKLYKTDVDIFIFVAQSIGRGFNILQGEKNSCSLIGSMFFLVRPYPTPDDFKSIIHNLHSMFEDYIEIPNRSYHKDKQLYKKWAIFNGKMISYFEQLMNEEIFWKQLDEELKESISFNLLVMLFQTMGRGLRGGTGLYVFFVDAAFAGEETLETAQYGGGYTNCDGTYSSMLAMFEYLMCNSNDFLIDKMYEPLKKAFKGIILR